MRRKKKERRFNLAAACMVEWTSSGFQPQRVNVQDIVELSFVEQAIRELGAAQR